MIKLSAKKAILSAKKFSLSIQKYIYQLKNSFYRKIIWSFLIDKMEFFPDKLMKNGFLGGDKRIVVMIK
jgi:hypothetical protein